MYFLHNITKQLIRQQLRHIKRFKHDLVRVRFAPSPTGYLHLGGLRTALYNYLYARSQNGKFLLRIEDTDQTRLVQGATESLIEDLLWVGIEIDEGPIFGGPYGPYVQSERIQLYNTAVKQLIENDTAYHCFCTERRLDLLRKEAVRARQVPRYDNKCRHLTKAQVAEQLAKQTAYCIRFKLDERQTAKPFDDLIYGQVLHNIGEHEGDPVIMKTDKFPTYHFANVVDDHYMGITHVLRGVEWQVSTPKHLLLYSAFGWQPPKFGHLPLLINADGTKLSKRQGDIGIKSFRDRGYLPSAVNNYVVSAGGGFNRAQATKPNIYDMQELTQQFDMKRINAHPSRLNPLLLDDFNRLQIAKLLTNERSLNILIAQVQRLIKDTFPAQTNLDLDAAHIKNVLNWSITRVTFLKDLVATQLSFLWVKPTNYVLKDLNVAQLQRLIKILSSADFDNDDLNQILRSFAQEEKLKFAQLMKTIRAALSGLKEGPGVAEMLKILGKTVVLQRLNEVKIIDDTARETSKETA